MLETSASRPSVAHESREPVDAAWVKQRAKALGADLVGIASAKTLNAFPPDPRWPQTPERISPYCKSVIVIVQRIPAGAFRCKTNTPVQYLDMLVLRKMDKVAFRLAEELERRGHPSLVTAAQETEWTYKRASYGRLSTRHLGVEAGPGHAGPGGQHPHARIRAARLPDRHPHRTGARGRPADHGAGVHRRVLQPVPAFVPGRRGAAMGHRQAQVRDRGAGVRLRVDARDFRAAVREPGNGARNIPLARFLRLLAGAAARGRIVRRLPALPRRVPGRQRLPRAPCRHPESHPGKDAGKSRAGKAVQGQARGARNRRARGGIARPVGMERALGRARRLQGHRGAPDAAVQERAGRARARQIRGRQPRPPKPRPEMPAMFKRRSARRKSRRRRANSAPTSSASPTARSWKPIRRIRPTPSALRTSPTSMRAA